MKPTTNNIISTHVCAYCTQICGKNAIYQNDSVYCCFGCATLDGVLKSHLDLADIPVQYRQYDLPEVFAKAVEFMSDTQYRIRLHTPNIHCSSCVELIEDLPSFDDRIIQTRVNFEERSIEISASRTILLSELAFLLDRLGYPPQFDLQQAEGKKAKTEQRRLLNKLAITGFCFGNSMLFSLPHYLGLAFASDIFFSALFSTLNMVLSLVVVFYGAKDYLSSAFKSVLIKKSHINIPIAIGIVALWFWSIYEVVAQIGFGYFDSLAGLIFFLLVGKWFQARVYKKITFERSLHDMLPLSVRRTSNNNITWTRISDLQAGDVITIKHEEVIPVSGKLIEGDALIDYSFVTGEADPKNVTKGEMVFIGGKQVLSDIQLLLISKPDPDTIWSAWKTPKKANFEQHWTNLVSKYFTPIILFIAVVAAVAWFFIDPSKSVFVLSAVLIVACPCALALSAPFTYGSVHRFFSRNGLYLKSVDYIAKFKDINHLVFDKTGTLTESGTVKVTVIHNTLNERQSAATKSLALQSNHVIGNWLQQQLTGSINYPIHNLQIAPGLGVSGQVAGMLIRIGSASYLNQKQIPAHTHAFVEVNGIIKALFTFGNVYKSNLGASLHELGHDYKISVLSGDNSSEAAALRKLYGGFDTIQFNSKPEDKKQFMEHLSIEGDSAIMVGDGLNDQVALSTSDLGLAVADNINGFYPNSDGVLMSDSLTNLPKLMALGRYAAKVLHTSLAFSIMYNLIGISFAVTGLLNPLIAAILMPLSSITVVGLVTALVSHKSKILGLK